MSFGLKIGFGHLCKQQADRENFEDRCHEKYKRYIETKNYINVVFEDGSQAIINKNAISVVKTFQI